MRRIGPVLIVLAVCSLSFSTPVRAQMCEGSMPITRNAPISVLGGIGYADQGTSQVSATTYGGGVAGGTDSWFVSAGVGGVNYRYHYAPNGSVAYGASAVQVGVEGGPQIVPERKQGRMALCPVVLIGHEFGPNFAIGTPYATRVTSTNVGGGLSFGYLVAEEGNLTIVPTASFRMERVFSRAEFGIQSSSVSDNEGSLSVGVGFLMHKRLSLTPAVVIPIITQGNSTALTLSAAFTFGRWR